MAVSREQWRRYLLTGTEDSYASSTAQNPSTSRRVKSWIPSIAGDLMREGGLVKWVADALPSAVRAIFEFDKVEVNGAVTRHHFVATSSALYEVLSDGTVEAVQEVGVLTDAPAFCVINNILHIDDGSQAWIFDGQSWVKEGLVAPKSPPARGSDPGEGDVGDGTITISDRYYWTTFADHTDERKHESSGSPRILLPQSITTQNFITVQQRAGKVTTSAGSMVVVGTGTDFSVHDVGMTLRVGVGESGAGASVNMGKIASVESSTQLTLEEAAPEGRANDYFTIAPERATHWHLYCSDSPDAKNGFLLTEVAITTPWYGDSALYPADDANTIINVDIPLPVRNDPPPPGAVMDVHAKRIFRRWGARPNYVVFSADLEVLSLANGNPNESYPGADEDTQSDILNKDSFPDQSNRIRSIRAHGDGVFISTERQTIPYYASQDETGLVLMQFAKVKVMGKGAAGRFAAASLAEGYAFVSYDKKALLYPSTTISTEVVTAQLQEIGLPLRRKLEQINSGALDQVMLTPYSYGRRNWLVLSYQDNAGADHTWVLDLETKGWFELQQGFTATAVVEVSEGNSVLVGGAADGTLYVIDDITGTFAAAATLPQAIYRPALIDFGNPGAAHNFFAIEYELTDAELDSDLTVYYWLDPLDVDNVEYPVITEEMEAAGQLFDPLRKAGKIVMQPVAIGSNLYRGFPYNGEGGGSVCRRLLIEVQAQQGPFAGGVRGLAVLANPVPGLL